MAKARGKLRQDWYYRLAKEQGYRSRAAFNLLQLDRRFSFLPTARAVLDLGAAPGGWLQVAVRTATAGAFVVGVDLARIRPIRGAISLKEDIAATSRCSAAVRKLMDSKGVAAFDVVLHDGVGKKNRRKRDGAQKATTRHRQSALVIDAVRLATTFLAPKGTFITKFTGSKDLNAIIFCLKQLFEKVQPYKPIASRIASAEIYFVCLEYKAPAKIQPELFDLNYLFTVSLENKPRDEVETQLRGLCMHESMSYFKRCPASEFVWSEADIRLELVSFFVAISFDDPASLPIKNHELTTTEVVE
uniref:Uncharacterized protein n=2 Tax=Avena sativa TaxID=4498 RepID=A0ACD5YF69_AVESA